LAFFFSKPLGVDATPPPPPLPPTDAFCLLPSDDVLSVEFFRAALDEPGAGGTLGTVGGDFLGFLASGVARGRSRDLLFEEEGDVGGTTTGGASSSADAVVALFDVDPVALPP
jgi:hypothetical protein